MAAAAACRACGASALERILDLGDQPLAGTFPRPDEPLDRTWPLRVAVCGVCMLLQLEPTGAPPEVDDPAFRALAGESAGLRAHGAETARTLRDRLGLTPRSRVVELGSHGNRLRSAMAEIGVPTIILETDPDAARAEGGLAAGVHAGVLGSALGTQLREEHGPFDAVIDDFLLAHLPDLDDAVAGLAALTGTTGELVLTVDHALPVVTETQFDALRHGHHAVFSLTSLTPLLGRHGLTIVDATLLPIYGGSLRVHARAGVAGRPVRSVDRVRRLEDAAGLSRPETYRRFGARARDAADALRDYLARAAREGRAVAGYGAPSRAATALVAAGIDRSMLPFTVDRARAKQGRTIPGARIPIEPVERLLERRPDEVLLLAWPMADEIVASLPEVEGWGGRFVHPFPTPHPVGAHPAIPAAHR